MVPQSVTLLLLYTVAITGKDIGQDELPPPLKRSVSKSPVCGICVCVAKGLGQKAQF